VLLGEPGIGKSWTLQQETSRIQNSLKAGAKLVFRDLRSFSSESRLMAELFDSEIFENWRKGDWILHLHLDSLDECLLRIDSVAALLADELPKQPVDRLHLRIACRTAPWPAVLEKALVDAFGECHAYELVPLRRLDVERAAEESGIVDPNAFLKRIDELDVSSLAIKPVTLKFLLSTYMKDGDFPKDHLELYEKGCRILCEESSDSRRAAGRRGRLNPDERLALASRIAAVTQLCKRFAVYTAPEAEGVPPEDVFVNHLIGGVEPAIGDVAVSADALWEALDTGLFSSRGSNRIGWAHQTYAEFLTARYCNRRKMPIRQIRPLIFHPSEQGRRLVPQLHEVAAWMSAMNPEIFKAVANSDPEALLGAAAASFSDDQRRLIVDSLLQQASGGRTLHLRWGLVWLYRKLNHAQLPGQLRPYLRDAYQPIGARQLALDIAWSCQVEKMGPELADIALDPSADRALRNSAAAAAADVGSLEVRARLKPLAFGEACDDPDDELKGSGLRALWPDSITAAELFPLLTPPKQANLSSAYSRFLYDHVIEKLPVQDLPRALDWHSKQENHAHLLGPIA
jgi:predicted NACHT family NTPase